MDKEELGTRFLVFGSIVIVILLFWNIASIFDNIRWNNGYHSCGGKWEYVQPVGHAYTTTYLYECDKCGKTHEFGKKR